MKRKYCLIRMDGELSLGSFVYVIWVGSGLHDTTLLALVEEYCKDCGWYFKRWSAVVDSAIELRTKLTRVDGTKCVTPYQMIQLTMQQCYDAIIDDSFANLERSHVMSMQEKCFRFRNDINFLKAMNNVKRNTTCPPLPRKNLSRRKRNAFYDLAGPIALLVVLIILDALVSNILL